jgi:hypothetical protein
LTKNEKDKLFENSIQVYVKYSKEWKQKGKKVVMKIIFHAWRSYKSKFMKIWRDHDTPFRKYKDLIKEDWARFVEKCKSEHFAANSLYMQWLRSQNELDHHLGNTGYAEKQRKWQQEDERLVQESFENPYDKFHGRLGPFMRAHSMLTESDNDSFYSESTSEVAQKDLRGSSEDSNGERETDSLTKALQTKEQRGCVRGVFSKLSWKEGFLVHKSMYQKQKMTSIPHADVEELKRHLRREVLGDLSLYWRLMKYNSLTLVGS